MACPKPTDAGADLARALDSDPICSYGGRIYAIGEGFKLDCNSCNCTSYGIACTAMVCPHDAGADSHAIDATSCALSANLTFGRDGGNGLYVDVNRLTATRFTITRDYTLRAEPDGGTSSTCSPAMPSCGSTGAVTIATINADLANADVQSAVGGPQDPVPLFGTDPRPVDGTVYSIALDDGRKVLVGGPCASLAMSSCRSIPAGLVQLVQDLQKLASAMLADPACKSIL